MKKIFSKAFALGVMTSLCYYFAFSLPVWTFDFKAPQYPQGLRLNVHLTRTTGDVQEIDIINHYIGMQKLEYAAKNLKKMVPYVLGTMSLIALWIGLAPNGVFMRLLSLPLIGFPVGFFVTFYYWLYRFGHELNPQAPVRLTPFTPKVLGTGIIGQFETFALPASGFYLICLASAFTLLQLYLKNKPEL